MCVCVWYSMRTRSQRTSCCAILMGFTRTDIAFFASVSRWVKGNVQKGEGERGVMAGCFCFFHTHMFVPSSTEKYCCGLCKEGGGQGRE